MKVIRETPWYGWLLILVAFLAGGFITWFLLHSVESSRNTREISLENCTTINENTKAVYQMTLAFKALATVIEKETDVGKLTVRVEEPDYLDC